MKHSLIWGSIASLLLACQQRDSHLRVVWGQALGTTYHVKYKSPENRDYSRAFNRIFDAVNASLSTYIPHSDISRINRGDTTVVVDSLFVKVLNRSRAIWRATQGYFDPTVGILVNAWGFGPSKSLAQLDSAKVDSLMQFVGLQKVQLLPDGRIKKENPNVFLDFNALAKGYTLDLIAHYLDAQKVHDYLIEIGGEVRSRGEKHPGQPWSVGIERPEADGTRRVMETLYLKDASMATSGNYRKFRVDSLTGRKYVHILDPHTGYSALGRVLSASVLAPDCMTADAYATALMAMARARAFLAQHKELDALLIYDAEDGLNTYATKGFRQRLEKE